MTELECNRPEVLRSAIWKYDQLGFVFPDFLTLAVYLNLFEYVEAKILRLESTDQVATVSRLLVVAALKRQAWLRQTATTPETRESRSAYGSEKEYSQAVQSLLMNKHDLMRLSQEKERDNPNVLMVQILMRNGADPDYEAYGQSARQVLDSRRWEHADPSHFESIMQTFDPTKDSFGKQTGKLRVPGFFHRKR